MSSSEEILLQVSRVRYEKADGTLYLMGQQMTWKMENRDTPSVSHLYSHIKALSVSPEGKGKAQLRVVLHSGVTSTFHFVKRDGLHDPAVDQNRVKEFLKDMLLKVKRKAERDLKDRSTFLASHPASLRLYKDLVIPDIITSEEFWTHHATEYNQAAKLQPQETGVSGAFLADIKPQTSGENDLKYIITTDTVESIFKTYPAVKRKYIEDVPKKLTAAQFWKEFLQSHYYHKSKNNLDSKGLFTECEKVDVQRMKREILNGVQDPLLNIASFEDKVLLEDYCMQSEQPASDARTATQSIIQRLNQHSFMVFKASNGTAKQSNPNIEKGSLKRNRSNEPKEEDTRISKKRRIQDKITYGDLEFNDNNRSIEWRLNMSMIERYQHGPMPEAVVENVDPNDVIIATTIIQQETKQWQDGMKLSSSSKLSSEAAMGVLGELTQEGAVVSGFQGQQPSAPLVPTDIVTEVTNLYRLLQGLLRHFWKCFSADTPASEEKVLNMYDALTRFQSAKLKPFEDKLKKELSHLAPGLTKHLNQLLEAANQKLRKWRRIKSLSRMGSINLN